MDAIVLTSGTDGERRDRAPFEAAELPDGRADAASPAEVAPRRARILDPQLIVIGLAGGVLSGLLGVGGGS